MKLLTDRCRWYTDSEGFWVALRVHGVEDRRKAAQLSSEVAGGWEIEAKKVRKKRGLTANAYYWQLLGQVADKLRISRPAAHNLMLRRYGPEELVDGRRVTILLPDTEAGEEKALEAETYHIKPTSQVREGKDGVMYRTYILLRGSSTFDVTEMSHLIDGLVGEAKGMGIETATPDELAILKERLKDAQANESPRYLQDRERPCVGAHPQYPIGVSPVPLSGLEGRQSNIQKMEGSVCSTE